MKNTHVSLSEDEKLRTIQEALNSLQDEIRDELERYISRVNELLEKADEDVKNLMRLTKVMTTVASLRYMLHRLRTTGFECTMDSVNEQEMLTTAFVVTYSRLFADGKDVSRISDRKIPKNLKPFHKELISMRNERYAHNGEHDSVRKSPEIEFDGAEFYIKINYEISMHVGGRNEWEDLVKFVNEYVYAQIFKIIERLSEKTGCKWNFPHDLAPEFIGESE